LELETDPEKRTKVDPDNVWSAITRKNGRTGIGAKNHCAHGKNEVSGETILDWQPFDYYTIESIPNIEEPGPFDAIVTHKFVPTNNGSKTQYNLHYKFLTKTESEFFEQSIQRFKIYLVKFLENMNKMILAEIKE
jgi:hypothetical protein